MFTFLFTVNVERIFRELLKRMRHLLDFWKIIRTLLQSMNSMCKLQKYDCKNIFIYSLVHIFIFYRGVPARDVMEKLMYAFMNWDMGMFIQLSLKSVGYTLYVKLRKITSSQKIPSYQILSSGGGINETASFLVCMNGVEEIAFGFVFLKNETLNAWELQTVKFFGRKM